MSKPIARHRSLSHLGARALFALVVVAALAGAARGDDALTDKPTLLAQAVAPAGAERFVPRSQSRQANVEIRADVSIMGSDVTLQHVCRWNAADDAAMQDLADLMLLRLPVGAARATIDLDQIRSILHDAGVNLAGVNFAGAVRCTITRADAEFDERKALHAWATQQGEPIPGAADAQPALAADAITVQGQRLHGIGTRERTSADPRSPAAQQPPLAAQQTPVAAGTLRALLLADVANRLKLSPDALQVDFRAEDRATLDLPTAQFGFRVDVQRGSDLGEQRWLVSVSNGAAVRKVQVVATARAWQDQVLVARPIAFKQTITPDLLEGRRVLVDRLGDRLATMDAAIGGAAARELRPGTVLTGKMISPVELARSGQLVTVLMRRGAVEIKTIATAMQAGSYGQIIRVKNEQTRQQFDVQLTGPQMAVGGDAIRGTELGIVDGR